MNRHNESIVATVEILQAIPSGRRAGAFWLAFRFEPDVDSGMAEIVPRLRAVLATVWEQTTRSPVPIAYLRRTLTSNLDSTLAVLFGRLNTAVSNEQIAQCVQELISELAVRFTRSSRDIQPSLFAVESAAATSHDTKWRDSHTVSDLHSLIDAGRRFSTIYADPPWAYDNEASRAAAANHYATMSVDEICAEPVPDLAEETAHLHLWTTNAFLRDAFCVIDAWGFQFKSCLVWVKEELGMGNYWRVSHEFLLLGVRGSRTFSDRTKRSWIFASRTNHSKKPAAVRALIEQVSPGPYLEMYGREELPGTEWTVYGDHVERRLF